MKTVYILIVLTLFTSCISKRYVKRTFSDNKVEIHNSFDCAVKNSEKIFMIIVFNDNDTVLYNFPITKILQIDSTKEDVLVYKCLARDFSVIKLYRNQFDALVNENKYGFDKAFVKAATEYNPDKAFLFVTTLEWYFYFARTLDSPKAVIHDIIWVKFGP